jgi:hypothetical protein
MKKNLLISMFFIACFVQAQSPQLTVKGIDSIQVKMSQMLINVKIVGNIAYTTTEMHFFNKGKKQMEAELLFPLPEGVSVSRYAIDINGKMREAVPVNKNKGKQVFEAVEHRRVDPGLLEKVEGNNFRTRIYPILPNNERIVLIGYEQELSNLDKNNLAYQLVSKYPYELEKFELNISVLGTNSTPIVVDGSKKIDMENTATTTWNKAYTTSIKKSAYLPSEKMIIKIPIQEEIPSVVMQSVNDQHYFYANTFIDNAKIKNKTPNSIGIIWDVSLSCKNRNLKKELNLLNDYFATIKNTEVTLYFLGYTFEKKETFTITNGNWAALKTFLEKVTYDGGTRFSQLKMPLHDAYLFFTDGLSSLSANPFEKNKRNCYTISSSVASDYAYLNYTAMKSGGNFINLNQLNTEQAVDKLVYQNLKFLGIKENYLVTEVFPAIGTTVSGSFSISGISLKPKNEVVLLFGYNDTAIIEKKIVLNSENQNNTEVNVERLWAQKKIADLELQYKENATEIETTGQKYGIITQNTSLIVLENVNDYITYGIVPPAELRVEFDRIAKQQQESLLAKQHSNWENVANYHNELTSWWDKNIKYSTPKVVPQSKNKADQIGFVAPVRARAEEVTSESIKGDADAELSYEPGSGSGTSVIQEDNAIGTTEIRDRKIGEERINTNANLQEIVVVGYGRRRSNSVSRTLTGAVAGLQVQGINSSETSGFNSNTNQTDTLSENEIEIDKEVKTTSWNPNRTYLKALESAPQEKKYEVYLALRDIQEHNPSFYFDVANYFYNTGNKKTALLILSTIADLGLENHQLYKSLTYQLRQWEAYEDALFTANQVVKWREQEPQSHRDLGLTLEDNKQYQAAFDELIKALEVNYYSEMRGQYEGVEDIILMDINRMISEHNSIKTNKLDPKYLNKIPVDVRIILNWNQMDTDIDLHIIEPTNEECYYAHTSTAAGARFSKDFTQGYGPEQYLLRNAIKGKYSIKTNFYGETALTENGPTTVMVEIYTRKPDGSTERKLQTIQLGKIKENQNLATITID